MSLSKFSQIEKSHELTVLLAHRRYLEQDLNDTNLSVLLTELEKRLVISKEITKVFHSLDDNVDPGVKIRYLLQQICKSVAKYSALFGNFLIALSNVEKKNVVRLLTNHINKLRGVEEIWLVEKDLPWLINDLFICAQKWREIGLMLRLPLPILDSINRDHDSDLNRLQHVLNEWLKGNYKVTLTELQNSLRSNLVNQKEIADKLHVHSPEKQEVSLDFDAPSTKKIDFRIVSQSCSIRVADGKSVLFEVQIISSDPVTFTWLKDNDRPLSDGKLYSGTDNNILLVHRVCQSTKGTYKCLVKRDILACTPEIKKWESNGIELSVIYTEEKQKLIKEYSELPEVKKNDEWAMPTTSKYINLALIEVPHQHQDTSKYCVPPEGIEGVLKRVQRKRVGYEEVFGEYKSQAIILVEGRPGSGKTTLAHKLMRDWALENALRHADYVFLLSLRGYQRVVEVKDKFVDLAKKANLSQGEGVCFILDGLDEWKWGERTNELKSFIIEANELHLAMIIVMSRPAATKQYRDIATQRIELLGFNKQKVHEYIEAYPFNDIHDIDQDNESLSSMLIKYVNEHTNMLHMCYLPVHAAIICFLYITNKDNMPETETQIYKYYIISIILRTMQKKDPWAQLHSLDKVGDPECNKGFAAVCTLAFEMTCESKQVILDPNTFSLHPRHPYNSLLTIDTVAHLYGNLDKSITFLHLTVQEYLAAHHVAGQTVAKQSDIIKKYGSSDHMQNMWKFYCGILASHDDHLGRFEQLMKTLATNHLHKVECAYETQEPEACLKLVQAESCCLNFHSLELQAVNFTAIGFVLKNAATCISEVNFRICTAGLFDETVEKDELQSLVSQLDPSNIIATAINAFPAMYHHYMALPDKKKGSFIQELTKIYQCVATRDLSNLDIGIANEWLSFLSDINKSILTSEYSPSLLHALQLCAPNLCLLNLSQNCFGFDGAAKLSQVLKHCVSLRELDISVNMFGSSGAIQLAEGLKYCASLEFLNMSMNNIDLEGEKAITTATAELTKLTNINISFNSIGQIAFAGQPNLMKLDVCGTSIGPSLTRELQPRLPPTIVKINLSNNHIDCEGALVLSVSLKSCKVIKNLFLSCNKIGFEAALAIIDSVSASIEKIDLSHNIIGDEYLNLFYLYPDLQLDLSHNTNSERQAEAEGREFTRLIKNFEDFITITKYQ